jgi:hypothetical protein
MSVRLTLSRDEVRAMVLMMRRYLTSTDRDVALLAAVDSLLLKLLANGTRRRRRRKR